MDLDAAHKDCSRHRPTVEASELCGCFYCCKTFLPTEIMDWVGEPDPVLTALCPRCGIDAVIGSASGWPITGEFLEAMRVRWFDG